jgi:Late embryogenesis abundant protein
VGKSKNSSLTPILVGGGLFAAWFFWTRANALKSLIFVPRGLGVQGGGVSLLIGVQNPTSAALMLNGLAGSLVIQGQNIGSVTDFQPMLIAPGGETPINLLITPNYFGIAAGVINAIDGNEGDGSIRASLSGTANINGFPLPVNLNFF